MAVRPKPVVGGQQLILVLSEIEWVLEFQLSAKEVNHIDEVVDIAVAPGSSLGQLYFVVDALQDAISEPRLDELYDA